MKISPDELEIGIERERLADEQNLLTPRDIYIFYQMYKEYRESKKEALPVWKLGSLYEKEAWKRKRINEDQILTSLFHLRNHDLITFKPPPGILDPSKAYLSLNYWGMYRMGVPVDPKDLNDDELDELMHERMSEAKKRIEGWIKMENATKEIKEIEKELRKSQQEMLRNMVGIFAIFVSIFSFIIISSNSALSMQPREICDLVTIILVIIVPMISLLVITYFMFIRSMKTK